MDRSDPQVQRNPVPSLLRSLMREHLDPGYRAAADAREHAHTRTSRLPSALWLALGAVMIVALLSYAAVDAAERIPGNRADQAELRSAVRDAEDRVAAMEHRYDELAATVDSARTTALAGDEQGAPILRDLSVVEGGAALEPVHGPGLVVTLTDPPPRPGLSDSAQRTVTGRAVVLDRDLQMVVNALWRDGAEAVAVDGVRVGPNVTIRQAGGAMLVDNRPVFSPYEVAAIGPAGALETGFVVSDAYLRMSSVKQLYGIGFAVAASDDINLPAASMRGLHEATTRESTHYSSTSGER
ncbi:MAG: DUF881 domain-containing protein [Rhodococcus sp.]|nr:DUF881 domain-containing protein [Rhodococcus sp. (in: high G+C Gram-positive bacteria)]